MKILITGATGLIGKKLIETLFINGMGDIRVLTRNKSKAKKLIDFPVEVFKWNPNDHYIEKGALEGIDSIIHLAGENVANKKWTNQRKLEILESRRVSTGVLLKKLKEQSEYPKKFISSSAVGIYGANLNDNIIDEESEFGTDYLSNVCKIWEKSLIKAKIPGMKTHVLRTGIVLSPNGGALGKMEIPFKLGLGGKIATGNQYMSWIHIEDLVNQFLFLLKENGKFFAYNGTAPNPVTNITFTKTLGKVLHRPTLFPVPAIALKMAFGDMADMLTKGQRVIPRNFQKEGFKYKFSKLEDALEDIFHHHKKGEEVFKKYQWVAHPVEDVFPFFSNEKNLELITPPHLNFKVLDKTTLRIEKGTEISYKLKNRGIPLKWKSLISSFEKEVTFTDEQIVGPYSKWTHTHDFIPCKEGTLLRDRVVYKLPFGKVGKIIAGIFIKKDVENIFSYRNKIIKEQIFNNRRSA